jgi:multiple sugar transport system permease protein
MNRYAIEVRAVKILKPPGIAFFMLIAVSPFLYIPVLLSVRDMSEVSESPGSLVPPLDEISFDAYQRVLRSVEDGGEGFTRFIVNSAGLAAGTVVVTLAVSILGAYACTC